MSTRNALKVGRILGVDIKLDYSWFIVFALVIMSLSGQYFPGAYPGWSSVGYWTMGTITAVLFFLSVLAHELAHSLISQASGVPVQDITLFIFGGAAQITDEPKTATGEFWMALVGPLTSLALAGVAGAVMLFAGGGNAYLLALASWLTRINVSLALFNLIPGFPLDGGRVFRATVWAITGDLKLATRVASRLGRVVAYGFIFWGIVQLLGGNWADGLWIAFIGWFLENAAMATYRRIALRDLLAGHTAREVMTSECSIIPRHLTLDVLVDQVILPSGRRCFPVQEGGELYGLVTVHNIKEVPRGEWKVTRVQDVMIAREQLKSVSPDEDLNVVFDRMTADDVNQLAVVDNGQLLGMLARDNLLNFIRLKAELAA